MLKGRDGGYPVSSLKHLDPITKLAEKLISIQSISLWSTMYTYKKM